MGTIKFYRNLPFNGLPNYALWMPQEGRVSNRDLLVTQQLRGYTHEFRFFGFPWAAKAVVVGPVEGHIGVLWSKEYPYTWALGPQKYP